MLPVNVLTVAAIKTGGGDNLAGLAAGAAVQLRDQIAHRLRAASQEQFVKLRCVIPVRRRAALIGFADDRPPLGRYGPRRRDQESFGSAGPKLISIRVPTGWSAFVDIDDAGRAVRLWPQGDSAIAGDDGERALRRQHGAGNDAQAVAELAALRQAQEFAGTKRSADAEKLGNLFRRTVEPRAVIFNKKRVPVGLDKTVSEAAAAIERVVAKLFEDEPPQQTRRNASLLLQTLDGPKQGPVGPLEHFQIRRIWLGA